MHRGLFLQSWLQISKCHVSFRLATEKCGEFHGVKTEAHVPSAVQSVGCSGVKRGVPPGGQWGKKLFAHLVCKRPAPNQCVTITFPTPLYFHPTSQKIAAYFS